MTEYKGASRFGNCTDGIRQEPVFKIKTVANAEEAKAYPINENITKGLEEFTKMMFKQGQAESEE